MRRRGLQCILDRAQRNANRRHDDRTAGDRRKRRHAGKRWPRCRRAAEPDPDDPPGCTGNNDDPDGCSEGELSPIRVHFWIPLFPGRSAACNAALLARDRHELWRPRISSAPLPRCTASGTSLLTQSCRKGGGSWAPSPGRSCPATCRDRRSGIVRKAAAAPDRHSARAE